MLKARVIKSVMVVFLQIEEDDKILSEAKTQEITIYRGQEFDYEKSMREVELNTLQKFEANRPKQD
jgi:hypothetical protein